MNHFIFKSFVFLCVGFFLAGCIVSWKPNIQDSSVNVTDTTHQEVSNEAIKED